MLIVMIWKPVFLFRKGLHRSILLYVGLYGRHLLAFAISAVGTTMLMKVFPLNPSNSYLSFFVAALVMEVILVLTMGGLLCLCESGMRSFIKRFLSIVR